MKIKLWETKPRLWFWLMCTCAFAMTSCISVCGDYCIRYTQTLYKVLLGTGAAISIGVTGLLVWLAVRAYKRLEKPVQANAVIFALVCAFESYALSELCMNAFVYKYYPLYNVLGYIMYAVPFLLGVVIFKHPKVWFCVWQLLFALYSVAQYYITEFRGSPIKFTDLSNIRSAMEIKEDYKLTFSFTVLVAVMWIVGMLFLTIKTQLESPKLPKRFITLGAAAGASAFFFLLTDYTFNYGLKNRIICLNFSGAEESRTSRSVGSLLMFYYDGVYNHVQIPDGYSTEKAEEMLDAYKKETPDESHTPIIIGILNESFADFSLLGEVKTNTDFLPVWHSLEKNTIKGYVTVSSYGGYSCNSEYEYLSGNTMHFLPLGSAVYTNYLDSKQDSLVSVFNDMDFDTVAVTPCRPGLWNIDTAYKLLDFKTSYFQHSINLPSNLKYNGQPADSVLFERVCQLVEKRNKSKGAFYWVTTMQNHAPYDEDVPGGVTLENSDDLSAERYLNSIRLSDQALGELIDYFKDYDEHVVIVMFGDHYPHLPYFAESLYGESLADLSVADYSRIHQTPFVVWSNRDMESQFIEDISLNYLNVLTMKAADLPLAPFQQELDKVMKEVPIISGFGCKTADGTWYQTGEDTGSYKDIITEYQTMQYYRMFDENRRILKQ